ncbi:DUF4843 domain-containing protein [Sphingobacterium paucimobilis]|uniref:DUF4843 domain-containing protein n=1 Tax=Sphingobacterium paucimobilis HER1398 TaxID=1346330 RepID=U2IY54_9SPHI|nr:DUF4843 domain-containing protein [Sphingobacterium paucimobilis]ERJ57614.1 hypothetical protein M472_02425 [Sphingobacterium paucimobilis HER1398]
MKNKAFILVLFLNTLLFSCKENADITIFDQNEHFLSFGVKNENRRWGEPIYLAETSFSFLSEDVNLVKKRLAIPIILTGSLLEQDREYVVQVDKEKTDFPITNFELDKTVFRKGIFVDTLFLTVDKIDLLRERELRIGLRMVENNNFKLGDKENISLGIKLSNMLVEPDWWSLYTRYMGTFYPEVYQKWIEMYYLGADPTPDVDTREPYLYWDNMPTYQVEYLAQNSPITYVFIQKLKEYFEENSVYPDGDSSRNPIKLP